MSAESATAAAIPTDDPLSGLNGLRRWFLFYALWLTALCVLALWAQGQYAAGVISAQKLWLAAVYVFYLSLCCTFFPLPTAWLVMLLASQQACLLDSVPQRVLAVATLGALATGIANLTEYHVWAVALRYRRVSRVRNTRLFQWASRQFHVSPFTVLVGFSFIPIPVDVIRWLAVACGYSRWRFFWAYVLGRWVRYGLLALGTIWFELGFWHILGVQGGLVLLAAARFSIAHRSPRSHAPKSTEGTHDGKEST